MRIVELITYINLSMGGMMYSVLYSRLIVQNAIVIIFVVTPLFRLHSDQRFQPYTILAAVTQSLDFIWYVL